jgi:hypothetical protein
MRTDFSASANSPSLISSLAASYFFPETCEHIIDQPFHVLAVERNKLIEVRPHIAPLA